MQDNSINNKLIGDIREACSGIAAPEYRKGNPTLLYNRMLTLQSTLDCIDPSVALLFKTFLSRTYIQKQGGRVFPRQANDGDGNFTSLKKAEEIYGHAYGFYQLYRPVVVAFKTKLSIDANQSSLDEFFAHNPEGHSKTSQVMDVLRSEADCYDELEKALNFSPLDSLVPEMPDVSSDQSSEEMKRFSDALNPTITAFNDLRKAFINTGKGKAIQDLIDEFEFALREWKTAYMNEENPDPLDLSAWQDSMNGIVQAMGLTQLEKARNAIMEAAYNALINTLPDESTRAQFNQLEKTQHNLMLLATQSPLFMTILSSNPALIDKIKACFAKSMSDVMKDSITKICAEFQGALGNTQNKCDYLLGLRKQVNQMIGSDSFKIFANRIFIQPLSLQVDWDAATLTVSSQAGQFTQAFPLHDKDSLNELVNNYFKDYPNSQPFIGSEVHLCVHMFNTSSPLHACFLHDLYQSVQSPEVKRLVLRDIDEHITRPSNPKDQDLLQSDQAVMQKLRDYLKTLDKKGSFAPSPVTTPEIVCKAVAHSPTSKSAKTMPWLQDVPALEPINIFFTDYVKPLLYKEGQSATFDSIEKHRGYYGTLADSCNEKLQSYSSSHYTWALYEHRSLDIEVSGRRPFVLNRHFWGIASSLLCHQRSMQSDALKILGHALGKQPLDLSLSFVEYHGKMVSRDKAWTETMTRLINNRGESLWLGQEPAFGHPFLHGREYLSEIQAQCQAPTYDTPNQALKDSFAENVKGITSLLHDTCEFLQKHNETFDAEFEDIKSELLDKLDTWREGEIAKIKGHGETSNKARQKITQRCVEKKTSIELGTHPNFNKHKSQRSKALADREMSFKKTCDEYMKAWIHDLASSEFKAYARKHFLDKRKIGLLSATLWEGLTDTEHVMLKGLLLRGMSFLACDWDRDPGDIFYDRHCEWSLSSAFQKLNPKTFVQYAVLIFFMPDLDSEVRGLDTLQRVHSPHVEKSIHEQGFQKLLSSRQEEQESSEDTPTPSEENKVPSFTFQKAQGGQYASGMCHMLQGGFYHTDDIGQVLSQWLGNQHILLQSVSISESDKAWVGAMLAHPKFDKKIQAYDLTQDHAHPLKPVIDYVGKLFKDSNCPTVQPEAMVRRQLNLSMEVIQHVVMHACLNPKNREAAFFEAYMKPLLDILRWFVEKSKPGVTVRDSNDSNLLVLRQVILTLIAYEKDSQKQLDLSQQWAKVELQAHGVLVPELSGDTKILRQFLRTRALKAGKLKAFKGKAQLNLQEEEEAQKQYPICLAIRGNEYTIQAASDSSQSDVMEVTAEVLKSSHVDKVLNDDQDEVLRKLFGTSSDEYSMTEKLNPSLMMGQSGRSQLVRLMAPGSKHALIVEDLKKVISEYRLFIGYKGETYTEDLTLPIFLVIEMMRSTPGSEHPLIVKDFKKAYDDTTYDLSIGYKGETYTRMVTLRSSLARVMTPDSEHSLIVEDLKEVMTYRLSICYNGKTYTGDLKLEQEMYKHWLVVDTLVIDRLTLEVLSDKGCVVDITPKVLKSSHVDKVLNDDQEEVLRKLFGTSSYEYWMTEKLNPSLMMGQSGRSQLVRLMAPGSKHALIVEDLKKVTRFEYCLSIRYNGQTYTADLTLKQAMYTHWLVVDTLVIDRLTLEVLSDKAYDISSDALVPLVGRNAIGAYKLSEGKYACSPLGSLERPFQLCATRKKKQSDFSFSVVGKENEWRYVGHSNEQYPRDVACQESQVEKDRDDVNGAMIFKQADLFQYTVFRYKKGIEYFTHDLSQQKVMPGSLNLLLREMAWVSHSFSYEGLGVWSSSYQGAKKLTEAQFVRLSQVFTWLKDCLSIPHQGLWGQKHEAVGIDNLIQTFYGLKYGEAIVNYRGMGSFGKQNTRVERHGLMAILFEDLHQRDHFSRLLTWRHDTSQDSLLPSTIRDFFENDVKKRCKETTKVLDTLRNLNPTTVFLPQEDLIQCESLFAGYADDCLQEIIAIEALSEGENHFECVKVDADAKDAMLGAGVEDALEDSDTEESGAKASESSSIPKGWENKALVWQDNVSLGAIANWINVAETAIDTDYYFQTAGLASKIREAMPAHRTHGFSDEALCEQMAFELLSKPPLHASSACLELLPHVRRWMKVAMAKKSFAPLKMLWNDSMDNSLLYGDIDAKTWKGFFESSKDDKALVAGLLKFKALCIQSREYKVGCTQTDRALFFEWHMTKMEGKPITLKRQQVRMVLASLAEDQLSIFNVYCGFGKSFCLPAYSPYQPMVFLFPSRLIPSFKHYFSRFPYSPFYIESSWLRDHDLNSATWEHCFLSIIDAWERGAPVVCSAESMAFLGQLLKHFDAQDTYAAKCFALLRRAKFVIDEVDDEILDPSETFKTGLKVTSLQPSIHFLMHDFCFAYFQAKREEKYLGSLRHYQLFLDRFMSRFHGKVLNDINAATLSALLGQCQKTEAGRFEYIGEQEVQDKIPTKYLIILKSIEDMIHTIERGDTTYVFQKDFRVQNIGKSGLAIPAGSDDVGQSNSRFASVEFTYWLTHYFWMHKPNAELLNQKWVHQILLLLKGEYVEKQRQDLRTWCVEKLGKDGERLAEDWREHNKPDKDFLVYATNLVDSFRALAVDSSNKVYQKFAALYLAHRALSGLRFTQEVKTTTAADFMHMFKKLDGVALSATIRPHNCKALYKEEYALYHSVPMTEQSFRGECLQLVEEAPSDQVVKKKESVCYSFLDEKTNQWQYGSFIQKLAHHGCRTLIDPEGLFNEYRMKGGIAGFVKAYLREADSLAYVAYVDPEEPTLYWLDGSKRDTLHSVPIIDKRNLSVPRDNVLAIFPNSATVGVDVQPTSQSYSVLMTSVLSQNASFEDFIQAAGRTRGKGFPDILVIIHPKKLELSGVSKEKVTVNAQYQVLIDGELMNHGHWLSHLEARRTKRDESEKVLIAAQIVDARNVDFKQAFESKKQGLLKDNQGTLTDAVAMDMQEGMVESVQVKQVQTQQFKRTEKANTPLAVSMGPFACGKLVVAQTEIPVYASKNVWKLWQSHHWLGAYNFIYQADDGDEDTASGKLIIFSPYYETPPDPKRFGSYTVLKADSFYTSHFNSGLPVVKPNFTAEKLSDDGKVQVMLNDPSLSQVQSDDSSLGSKVSNVLLGATSLLFHADRMTDFSEISRKDKTIKWQASTDRLRRSMRWFNTLLLAILGMTTLVALAWSICIRSGVKAASHALRALGHPVLTHPYMMMLGVFCVTSFMGFAWLWDRGLWRTNYAIVVGEAPSKRHGVVATIALSILVITIAHSLHVMHTVFPSFSLMPYLVAHPWMLGLAAGLLLLLTSFVFFVSNVLIAHLSSQTYWLHQRALVMQEVNQYNNVPPESLAWVQRHEKVKASYDFNRVMVDNMVNFVEEETEKGQNDDLDGLHLY